MNNDLNGGSRAGYRAKRKKTNLILNSLIVFVLLLIVVVAYRIFFSGNDKTAPQKAAQTEVKAKQVNGSSVQKQEKKQVKTVNKQEKQADKQSDGSGDQLQTIDSQESSPANTVPQTGSHTPNYDSSSADWQEMLAAISKATGVEQSNMTVWFLGSDKSTPNGSVGTISAKDNKQQKFRVYLQWVDGQGWTSTKVEPAAN